MMVMILEKVPPSLKGELSRWLTEISTGVYVGHASALVRDLLWEKCVKHIYWGRCYQIYRSNAEQGFDIRIHGDSERVIMDFDGLKFLAVKDARWHAFQQEEEERQKAEHALGTMTTQPDTSEG